MNQNEEGELASDLGKDAGVVASTAPADSPPHQISPLLSLAVENLERSCRSKTAAGDEEMALQQPLPLFAVGTVVDVKPWSSPGVNSLGGAARVVSATADRVAVKYVLDSRSENVAADRVSILNSEGETRGSRRRREVKAPAHFDEVAAQLEQHGRGRAKKESEPKVEKTKPKGLGKFLITQYAAVEQFLQLLLKCDAKDIFDAGDPLADAEDGDGGSGNSAAGEGGEGAAADGEAADVAAETRFSIPLNLHELLKRHDKFAYVPEPPKDPDDPKKQKLAIAPPQWLEAPVQIGISDVDNGSGGDGGDPLKLDESAWQFPPEYLPHWDVLEADLEAMLGRVIAVAPEGDEWTGDAARELLLLARAELPLLRQRAAAAAQLAALEALLLPALAHNSSEQACVQTTWREEPFPLRKYRKYLETYVPAADLEPAEAAEVMAELDTDLPDGYLGSPYPFEDRGGGDVVNYARQHQLRLQQREQQPPQQPGKRKRKRKKGGRGGIIGRSGSRARTEEDDEDWVEGRDGNGGGADSAERGESSGEEAADGQQEQEELQHPEAVRAQVAALVARVAQQATDRVNTERGVLVKAPKALAPLGNLKEAAVWGIDSYTRVNVEAVLLKMLGWPRERSIRFVEAVLLPAINAMGGHSSSRGSTVMGEALRALLREPPLASGASFVSGGGGGGGGGSGRISPAVAAAVACAGVPGARVAAAAILRSMEVLTPDHFHCHPKGTGVVCADPNGIPADTFVSEYLGELLPAWRWAERLDAVEDAQKRYGLKPTLPDFYNMTLERPRGDKRGYAALLIEAGSGAANLSSSLSHSCDANCTTAVAARGGRLAVVLTTTKAVAPGEELTMDYNSVTSSQAEYMAAVCLCGQGGCRGQFMHFTGERALHEVLRDFGITVAFANLLKSAVSTGAESAFADPTTGGKEALDNAVFRNHGIGEAALGRHAPAWLRRFVAGQLRYVELERRRLPDKLLALVPQSAFDLKFNHSSAEIEARAVMEQRVQSLTRVAATVYHVLWNQRDWHNEGGKQQQSPHKQYVGGSSGGGSGDVACNGGGMHQNGDDGAKLKEEDRKAAEKKQEAAVAAVAAAAAQAAAAAAGAADEGAIAAGMAAAAAAMAAAAAEATAAAATEAAAPPLELVVSDAEVIEALWSGRNSVARRLVRRLEKVLAQAPDARSNSGSNGRSGEKGSASRGRGRWAGSGGGGGGGGGGGSRAGSTNGGGSRGASVGRTASVSVSVPVGGRNPITLEQLAEIEAKGKPDDLISCWDPESQVKLTGGNAPKRKNLRRVMENRPSLEFYTGQAKKAKGSQSRSRSVSKPKTEGKVVKGGAKGGGKGKGKPAARGGNNNGSSSSEYEEDDDGYRDFMADGGAAEPLAPAAAAAAAAATRRDDNRPLSWQEWQEARVVLGEMQDILRGRTVSHRGELRAALLELRRLLLRLRSLPQQRHAAAADVLLCLAHTRTFAAATPYSEYTGSEVLVRARELGTKVPRSVLNKFQGERERRRNAEKQDMGASNGAAAASNGNGDHHAAGEALEAAAPAPFADDLRSAPFADDLRGGGICNGNGTAGFATVAATNEPDGATSATAAAQEAGSAAAPREHFAEADFPEEEEEADDVAASGGGGDDAEAWEPGISLRKGAGANRSPGSAKKPTTAVILASASAPYAGPYSSSSLSLLERLTSEGDPEDYVPLWDPIRRRKIVGRAAPRRKNLRHHLAGRPHLQIYLMQDGGGGGGGGGGSGAEDECGVGSGSGSRSGGGCGGGGKGAANGGYVSGVTMNGHGGGEGGRSANRGGASSGWRAAAGGGHVGKISSSGSSVSRSGGRGSSSRGSGGGHGADGGGGGCGSGGVAASKERYCNGDEVVHAYRRHYDGHFVLAQLLQWHNDGHGTDPTKVLQQGLCGCVRLPDASAAYTGTAPYGVVQRQALLQHLEEPGTRRNSWPKEVAAAFAEEEAFVKGTGGCVCENRLLFGSPVLDAALGQPQGLEGVVATLREELGLNRGGRYSGGGSYGGGGSSGANGRGGGSRKRAASNRAKDDVDVVAAAPCSWGQCENCLKWRKLPWHVNPDKDLGEHFYCEDNIWDHDRNTCQAPAEPYDDPHAGGDVAQVITWKVEELGDVEVGDWVDGFCARTEQWYPAKVMQLGYGGPGVPAPLAAGGGSGGGAGDGGNTAAVPAAGSGGEGNGGDGGGAEAAAAAEVTHILVHFFRWSARFDEWLPKTGERVMQVHTRTVPVAAARQWYAKKFGRELPPGADEGSGGEEEEEDADEAEEEVAIPQARSKRKFEGADPFFVYYGPKIEGSSRQRRRKSAATSDGENQDTYDQRGGGGGRVGGGRGGDSSGAGDDSDGMSDAAGGSGNGYSSGRGNGHGDRLPLRKYEEDAEAATEAEEEEDREAASVLQALSMQWGSSSKSSSSRDSASASASAIGIKAEDQTY